MFVKLSSVTSMHASPAGDTKIHAIHACGLMSALPLPICRLVPWPWCCCSHRNVSQTLCSALRLRNKRLQRGRCNPELHSAGEPRNLRGSSKGLCWKSPFPPAGKQGSHLFLSKHTVTSVTFKTWILDRNKIPHYWWLLPWEIFPWLHIYSMLNTCFFCVFFFLTNTLVTNI